MSQDQNIRKDLLLSLTEPEYARVDFLKAKQADSIYSEKVYAIKLMEALEYYISYIKDKEDQLNSIGNQVSDYKLSLFNETNGELYGHLGYGELESLANSIDQLIASWNPKKENTKPQISNIQPINWLKGDEALRQFLDIIKSAGLIEDRDTDDLIKEHFYVDGQSPTKEPEPMNWLKSKVLLAYLIEELSTKPERHDPFMESEKKWQLTQLHFKVKGKDIGRSLVNDIKQSRYPNGCNNIDTILKRLIKY